jgi:hypothetical protein
MFMKAMRESELRSSYEMNRYSGRTAHTGAQSETAGWRGLRPPLPDDAVSEGEDFIQLN